MPFASSSTTASASSSTTSSPAIQSYSTMSSSSTSLPRPKSSPSLHTHTYTYTNKQNKTKRNIPKLTPLSTTTTTQQSQLQAAQPPIMVALAGWPEPIYVSSSTSTSSAIPSALSSMLNGTSLGFEPLSSGQVYDGVPYPTPTSVNGGNPHKKIKSRPTTPPPSTKPSETQDETSSITLPSTEIAGKSDIPNSSSNDSSSSKKTIAPPSILSKVRKPNPIPNIVPKPISAPNLSIFAPVCQYLKDPSLGPCPFKSHPHDVRNMFPPTSHLPTSPTGDVLPLASTSNSSGQLSTTISSPTQQEISSPTSEDPISDGYLSLSSPELEKSDTSSAIGSSKNPQGLTNYFPIPGAGAPKPRALTRLNPKATSSSNPSSSSSKNPILSSTSSDDYNNSGGKRKTSSFNDPRYAPTAGILHKGRSLPVVPSWDSPPVNNGFPVTSISMNGEGGGKGKGKGKQNVDNDEKMDIDIKEEEIINSSYSEIDPCLLDEKSNGSLIKMEV